MNLVEQTMQALGIKTVRELSQLCKVSEKTITGWKKNITPNGEVLLNLFLENHELKMKLGKSKSFKKSFIDFIEDDDF